MIEPIDKHRTDLHELCRKYHVKSQELFGSAVDGTWDADRSDLDFLVDFLPEASERSFWGIFDLREELEDLFGRKVDLVMPSAVRNPYLQRAIDKQRKVLYAA